MQLHQIAEAWDSVLKLDVVLGSESFAEPIFPLIVFYALSQMVIRVAISPPLKVTFKRIHGCYLF
jgi:hypothetical protein